MNNTLPVALVIQQGGSSAEWYPSLYDEQSEAIKAIASHEDATYDAAGPFLIPPELGRALASDPTAEQQFIELIQTILKEVAS